MQTLRIERMTFQSRVMDADAQAHLHKLEREREELLDEETKPDRRLAEVREALMKVDREA